MIHLYLHVLAVKGAYPGLHTEHAAGMGGGGGGKKRISKL